jgi:hypothetical protein
VVGVPPSLCLPSLWYVCYIYLRISWVSPPPPLWNKHHHSYPSWDHEAMGGARGGGLCIHYSSFILFLVFCSLLRKKFCVALHWFFARICHGLGVQWSIVYTICTYTKHFLIVSQRWAYSRWNNIFLVTFVILSAVCYHYLCRMTNTHTHTVSW